MYDSRIEHSPFVPAVKELLKNHGNLFDRLDTASSDNARCDGRIGLNDIDTFLTRAKNNPAWVKPEEIAAVQQIKDNYAKLQGPDGYICKDSLAKALGIDSKAPAYDMVKKFGS
jgi:hypothetical protein